MAASGGVAQYQPTKELSLKYSPSRKGGACEARAFLNPEGEIQREVGHTQDVPMGIFLHTHAKPLKEDAERFSDIDARGGIGPLVETLTILEPRLRRLAVHVIGGVPMVNADIGLPQMIPVPLMGEGIGRLLSMLLAIYYAQDGVVLIDEVENGIHHSALQMAWRALFHAATSAQVQLFCTTHSWECVRAAEAAASAEPDFDFSFTRLERLDASITAIQYSHAMLKNALEMDLEVR